MAKRIEWSDLTKMEPMYTHCTEASDLGLRAGEWPESLPVAPNVGNGLDLLREKAITREGDLVAVVYRQNLGVITVHVLND